MSNSGFSSLVCIQEVSCICNGRENDNTKENSSAYQLFSTHFTHELFYEMNLLICFSYSKSKVKKLREITVSGFQLTKLL